MKSRSTRGGALARLARSATRVCGTQTTSGKRRWVKSCRGCTHAMALEEPIALPACCGQRPWQAQLSLCLCPDAPSFAASGREGFLPADDVSVGVARGEGGAGNRSCKDGLENKPVDGAGGKSSPPFPQLPKPSRAHQANRHLGHIPVNIGNAATFGRSRLFLIARRHSWEPCPEASVLMMSPYLSR